MPDQRGSLPGYSNEHNDEGRTNLRRTNRDYIQNTLPKPHQLLSKQNQETRHRTQQTHLEIKRL